MARDADDIYSLHPTALTCLPFAFINLLRKVDNVGLRRHHRIIVCLLEFAHASLASLSLLFSSLN